MENDRIVEKGKQVQQKARLDAQHDMHRSIRLSRADFLLISSETSAITVEAEKEIAAIIKENGSIGGFHAGSQGE